MDVGREGGREGGRENGGGGRETTGRREQDTLQHTATHCNTLQHGGGKTRAGDLLIAFALLG